MSAEQGKELQVVEDVAVLSNISSFLHPRYMGDTFLPLLAIRQSHVSSFSL